MIRALALWIVFAWCASMVAIYGFSTYSQTSIWDDKLQSFAIKMLQTVPSEPESYSARPVLALRADVGPHNNELTFQLWTGDKRLLASTPGAPPAALRPDYGEGFANVRIGGVGWRVFSVSDRAGKLYVQVGNPRSMIDADFQKHSLRAVSMATIPFALTGVLLWWSVRRALKPLAEIKAAALHRQRFDLRPLPTDSLPTEILPLVDSFNHLLVDLDQAVRAERRFISDAAHELRTPLSVLQTQVEAALRTQSPERREQMLLKLLSAVERSSRLSEQLLDRARLEAGGHAPVRMPFSLDEIVRHVASEFEVNAARHRRTIMLDAEPCRILCDIDEIGILLRNLVDNALRYTAEGGTVRVRCAPVSGDSASGAMLEVADDGPGVPEAQRQAIFERFHRVPGTVVRGSGIGLSLVARIAQMHQARIETCAGLGAAGFCVSVVFPRVDVV